MKRPLLIRLKKSLRKLNGLNILLITAFSGLLYQSVDILSSPYDLMLPNSQELETATPRSSTEESYQAPNFASFNSVASMNLFRPERSEYVKPIKKTPPPPPTPPKPERRLPDPNLSLDGVLLLDNRNKTAMISGNYFTAKARVNLKQQRFKEGEVLGNYKIMEITRRAVVLGDIKSGKELTLSLKFSGFTTAVAHTQKRSSAVKRPATPRPTRRARAIRPPQPQRVLSRTSTASKRAGGVMTSGRETIPAVYSGGRVYYPEHGSPPPQRISGDLSTTNEPPSPGN